MPPNIKMLRITFTTFFTVEFVGISSKCPYHSFSKQINFPLLCNTCITKGSQFKDKYTGSIWITYPSYIIKVILTIILLSVM